ncbi:MAG TPA: iron ABC transporter permease [Candidatus Korarchaeota archaeon]|nr:iron ABC transporter permease [Candidatus Korarchaeota archaeon]
MDFKLREELSSNKVLRATWYSIVVGFFLLFVLIPPIYLFTYLVGSFDKLPLVFGSVEIIEDMKSAISLSYAIAATVTIIDLIAALPMAWVLLKKEFRLKRFLDTLLDLPMALPTSALGFSVAMFWLRVADLRSAFWAVVALHVAMSYPYMLRTLIASLKSVRTQYEIAARTLGAHPFTVAKTVTLPIAKPGIIAGSILCFAKSLSETGGTAVTLSVIKAIERTGPVLIKVWKSVPEETEVFLLAGGILSAILIVSSLAILYTFRVVAARWKIPLKRIWSWEKDLSRKPFTSMRDLLSISFSILVVLAPSMFIALFPLWLKFEVMPRGLLAAIWNSILIALITTLINLVTGVPLSILIARSKSSVLTSVLDALVNIPLIVPTTALGFSISLFWSKGIALGLSDLTVISLAHISFTQPLLVRNVIASLEQLDPSLEDTARTLGANPLKTFRKITLPLISPGIIAGTILSFTRSLGETGATISVVPKALTAPVYIVELVSERAYSVAGISCVILLLISGVLLYALKRAGRGT